MPAPQIFLRGMRGRIFAPEAPVSLGKGEILRVWVEDALTAVRELHLRVHYDGRDGHLLELEAWDVAGNSSRQNWPLDT